MYAIIGFLLGQICACLCACFTICNADIIHFDIQFAPAATGVSFGLKLPNAAFSSETKGLAKKPVSACSNP